MFMRDKSRGMIFKPAERRPRPAAASAPASARRAPAAAAQGGARGSRPGGGTIPEDQRRPFKKSK